MVHMNLLKKNQTYKQTSLFRVLPNRKVLYNVDYKYILESAERLFRVCSANPRFFIIIIFIKYKLKNEI